MTRDLKEIPKNQDKKEKKNDIEVLQVTVEGLIANVENKSVNETALIGMYIDNKSIE